MDDTDLLHDLPPVASMAGDDFVAAIVESDGLFTLWWDDCVANVWVERYETLPLALLRLAVLGSLSGGCSPRGPTTSPGSAPNGSTGE
ncbi:MAG: hypothetical protein KA758_02790 [Acidimicrobiales bacterium]|nr:hypothetical protein [Acidimicrobiales bacterium]